MIRCFEEQDIRLTKWPVPQQPTTVIQQIPSAMPPPGPAVRPGHVREDLVELMMIQNAQMHQVIMNNMTMSALSAFGHGQPPPPAPEVFRYPVIVEDEDPEVFHHHYPPASLPSYPAWIPPPQPHPQPTIIYQDPAEHRDPGPSSRRDRRAVPPPPPPSATGTVGADIPPAAEYYDAERKL
ncbi:proline-rich protein 29-like [Conger conger]|uniref:proline-rich protein 29-like n=1 Tax=Conger conger TaxID=82655 RepID=UPI002A5AE893|nr:proline-rich protein 29-like [Conger conger]